jgi:hypothetical protein
VRLEEDGVDLLEIDGFGAIPHGFDQCADAEVSDGSERAFRTPCYQVDGLFGEGGVGQADTIQLGVDELPAFLSGHAECRFLLRKRESNIPRECSAGIQFNERR